MTKVQQVIDIIIHAQEDIATILTGEEYTHHALKLHTDLQRNLEYLALITGSGDVNPAMTAKLPEATTIAGQPIVHTGKRKEFDVTPEEKQVNELKAQADMAYDSFLTTDSTLIRKEYKENVIRAVAKKAGMKEVTRDNPAIIDVRFIDAIKAEIVKTEQFKLEQGQQKLEGLKTEAGVPTLDRQEEETFDAFFNDGDKATSEDAPESIEEIEALKDEKDITSKTIIAPGTPKAKGKK